MCNWPCNVLCTERALSVAEKRELVTHTRVQFLLRGHDNRRGVSTKKYHISCDMCVVHVYECRDCSVYSRIQVLDQRDFGVTVFSDVICRVEGCKRKSLAYRLTDADTFSDCTNVLCKDSTCRLVTVPKSCLGKWALEDSNILPVRMTHCFQGN